MSNTKQAEELKSSIIDDMIRRKCWSPQDSGFRPIRTIAEAKELIGSRTFMFRGSTGYAHRVICFGATGVSLEFRLGGKTWSDFKDYCELFRWYKFIDTGYPIGLPGEQTDMELERCTK